MKKVACAVLIFTMIIFLINPFPSDAGGYYGGGGYGGGGGYSVYRGGGHGGGYGLWWAPLAIVGGAVAIVANSVAPAPNYYSRYYAPYYTAPPVYVQPAPSIPPRGFVYVYPR